MLKKDVVQHFGSNQAIATALKLNRSAISRWGDLIPLARAYEIEVITKRKLKVDRSMYEAAANG